MGINPLIGVGAGLASGYAMKRTLDYDHDHRLFAGQPILTFEASGTALVTLGLLGGMAFAEGHGHPAIGGAFASAAAGVGGGAILALLGHRLFVSPDSAVPGNLHDVPKLPQHDTQGWQP